MGRAAPLQRVPRGPRETAAPAVQKKLAVGPARDRYEAEADRIAERVVRHGPESAPAAPPPISRLAAGAVQRQATAPVLDEEGALPERAVAQRAPAATNLPDPARRKEIRTTKVADPEAAEDKETAVQRSGDGPVAAPRAAEARIAGMRAAGGAPMAQPVRQRMEGGFGRTLSGVRLHTGAGAARAAKDVGARAFTVGRDVFFGAGQYRPETPAGARLLAHELVHTEQQKGLGNLAQTTRIQRDPDPARDGTDTDPPDPGPEFTKPGDPGTRIVLDPDGAGGTLYLRALQVPDMLGGTKGASNHPIAPGAPREAGLALTPGSVFTYSGKTDRGVQPVAEFQKQEYYRAAETELEPALMSKLPEQVENWAAAPDIRTSGGERRYYLRLKAMSARSASTIILGTAAEIADHKRIKIPNWDRTGAPARFDVDHAQELQLGGLDAFSNFWLLDSEANQDSGRKINQKLQEDINAGIAAAETARFWTGPNAARKPSFANFKNPNEAWSVEFAGFRDLSVSNERGPYWTRAEILAGAHLSHLTVLTEAELQREGFLAGGDLPARVSVFTSQAGGFRKRFEVNGGNPTPIGGGRGFFAGFDVDGVTVNETEGAAPYITRINGTMFRRRSGQAVNPTAMTGDNALKVVEGEGLGFSGYLDQADFRQKLQNIPKVQIAGASPITFEDAGVNENGEIYAVGYVTATKALFPQMNFPIYILGSDIFIAFPIPTERLNFGPVSVTEAALRLGVGDNGVFVEGTAGLAVDQLGSGTVEARVDRGNTIISGTFNFDLDFLDPASAAITYDYAQDLLSLRLEAGVGEGRLPGVQSGRFTATFSRDAVSFDGSMTLGGALSGVVVSATYSQTEGLRLGADNIQLPVERIPGITSATASLHAARDPETGVWRFGGTGTAVLGIAGATGEITIGVDGERVTFGGDLAVAKGPASGSISFLATNAPLDENGTPVEGEAGDSLTVFGRGRAEITFGRILRGSAEIELTPQASIILRGSIGLPPTFDVFPRQEYNRSLLTVETPDFPIWGVSLGGVGIGIFAFADAELSFNAFVGPGQLVDTQIGAEMDLDRPEDATITGQARFTVPAYAGFRLDIGGGLRARAAVAFVEGRVGLDGELGIAADASAQVNVAWNRTDGLQVTATAEANAQPKFRVGVNASVTAGVDLVLTEISHTWGPWRRTLGEFGPNMAMGVTIPVRWSEQNGIDFSLDDIQIRRPEFNTRDILKSSFEELV